MIRQSAEKELKRQQARLLVFEQGYEDNRLLRFALVNGDNKPLAYLDIQKWESNYHVNSSAAHSGLGHAVYVFAMMHLQSNEGGAGLFANRFFDCTKDALRMWQSLAQLDGLEVEPIKDPREVSVKAITKNTSEFVRNNVGITSSEILSLKDSPDEAIESMMAQREINFCEINQVYRAKPSPFYNALIKRGKQLSIDERREALSQASAMFDDMYELGRGSVTYPEPPRNSHLSLPMSQP